MQTFSEHLLIRYQAWYTDVMISAQIWFTFAVLFSAPSYCSVADWAYPWEQQVPLGSHAHESEDNIRRVLKGSKTTDQQPYDDTSSSTQCGYQACFPSAVLRQWHTYQMFTLNVTVNMFN